MRNDSRYNGFMIIHIDGIKENFTRQKDKQKAAIFAYISQNGPVARKDITTALHLRSTSVSMLVQELIDDGLVAEGQSLTRGRAGRPDIGLRIAEARLVAATIYVEGYKFIGSLVDMAGNILMQKSLKIPPQETNQTVLKKYKLMLGALKNAAPAKSECIGAGISAVGTIDEKNRTWVNADRWPKIKDLNVGIFENDIGIPIGLRRNLDIELEYMLEKKPECRTKSTILFHWGFGIGGAYAYQGKILDSPAGRYMDIGHTIVHSTSKKRCRCGLYGCLEAEAAIFGLLPLLQKRFPNLQEDSSDIDSILSDPQICTIPGINHAINTVGIFLSNLYKIFYPHRIFLVGPFARNPKVVKCLEKTIIKTFYAKLRDKVHHIDLITIPDGFSGCMWANAYPFFRKRLTELLAARV
ncbi:MAG: ROK family transcriptional regulator [Spirochaetia bacterium]|nr:ROK family transcriptional regulator [Spirochaetia bacterium]